MPFPVLTASGLTTAAPPEAFHPPMPSVLTFSGNFSGFAQ
jgi:hypothetical protein